MSDLIVGKSGGTSNADASSVRASLEWAEQTNLFIASAPGRLPEEEGPHSRKVTDMLLDAHEEHKTSDGIKAGTVDLITSRFSSIVEDLGSNAMPSHWIDAIPVRIREAARYSEDAASMLGERLQAEIYEGQGFTILDPAQAPHDLGSDPEAWRGWLQTTLAKRAGHCVLVGNVTRIDGQPRTFSRGGSDTSSGFAAYGLQAAMNWNLTDGPAHSADPKIVGKKVAQYRDHLLYIEGRELGRNGSGLVHPAAMVPLMLADIPTEIRDTFDKSAPFTLLDNDNERAWSRVGTPVALSLMNDVKVIRVHEPGMAEALGRLDAFESALSEEGITLVDSQGDGVDGQKYFVDSKNAEQARLTLSREVRNDGSAICSRRMSFITLVGFELESNLVEHMNTLAKSVAIGDTPWQAGVYPLSPGRHSLRIGIAPKDGEIALMQAHKALIESQ